MIRWMEEEKDFPAMRENPFAVRICGLHAAYGSDARFALFWRQTGPEGEACAWLSSFDGNLTLDVTQQADFAELAAFLQTLGGGGILLPGWAAGRLPVTEMETVALFCRPAEGNGATAQEEIDYAALHALLQSGGGVTAPPPYSVWYPDLCHRVRHQAAVVALERDGSGRPIAAALAPFLAPQGALLSGVVVRSELRGGGHGRRVVESLLRRLPAGRPVYALAREEAAGFYNRLGFVRCETAVLARFGSPADDAGL